MKPLESALHEHIVNEYLGGQDAADLDATTPLITTGVLDSISVLKLVMHLEQEYSITIEPLESTAEYLDSIERIAALINQKQATRTSQA